jgi:hypothetical protein
VTEIGASWLLGICSYSIGRDERYARKPEAAAGDSQTIGGRRIPWDA